MAAAEVVMEAMRDNDAFFSPEAVEPASMTFDQLPRLGLENGSGDPVSERF